MFASKIPKTAKLSYDTSSRKGNDSSPERQQVKSSNILSSSQVSKQTRKSGETIFPIYVYMAGIGVLFRCSRTANSVVCGPIWPKLEYVQDIMHVLVICNFNKDQNNSKVETLIFRHSRAAYPVSQLLNLAEIQTHPSFYGCPCYMYLQE